MREYTTPISASDAGKVGPRGKKHSVQVLPVSNDKQSLAQPTNVIASFCLITEYLYNVY